MAEIRPFKGILYNVSRVSMEDVLAPPYDVITPEFREALYMQSPYNIVRIDFGREEPGDSETENKYIRARRYLDAWRDEGIFIQSEKPSYYVYEMSYKIGGARKSLIGFLGLVKLEELGKGSVFPHECTHSKPKQDRLNLMRACEANTSPIFSLYKSSDRQVPDLLSRTAQTIPYIEAADVAGDIHRLWRIDQEEQVAVITRELADKSIFIADGHHRYETAYEFYREMISKDPSVSGPFDHVLMFLADMRDEGLTILPTHRLLKTVPEDLDRLLSEHFRTEPVDNGFDISERLCGKKDVFGFYKRGARIWHMLTYKGDGNLSDVPANLQDIDVMILHELIFKTLLHTTDIGYEMDVERALDKIRNGQFEAAFFLNPTKVEDVEKSALSSVRMPPKSTYFYPKLMTGLVINKF
ncbi:MAG TPA: DUF1015 domain-containing protein [Thermodesulfovibrionales bacterium]|nr:DUF1015 domain-containing protein [Thermodesulfovibrionales bacterium]